VVNSITLLCMTAVWQTHCYWKETMAGNLDYGGNSILIRIITILRVLQSL